LGKDKEVLLKVKISAAKAFLVFIQYLTTEILKPVTGTIIFMFQIIYPKHLWTPTLPMPASLTS
jgi:hypothetical protein